MNKDAFTTWSLYDSIVQSYRSNMIASQSLLLAVEAILFEKNIYAELLICAIGLFQLWYIWFPVINARAIISDFHKFDALYNFSQMINIYGNVMSKENEPPLTEKVYVRDKSVRDKANGNLAILVKDDNLKTNLRITRRKLDRYMPITFTAIWIIIITCQII